MQYHQRFLILCRYPHAGTESLQEIFSPVGFTEVISDSPGLDSIWYPDEAFNAFGWLAAPHRDGKRITAWERALYHLSLTPVGCPVWLVEDDVAGDRASFYHLIRQTAGLNPDLASLWIRTREEQPNWAFWKHAEGHFESPSRSFNPLCRLSPELLLVLLEFARANGGFVFQELLLASLARAHDMSCLDWSTDARFSGYFGKFHFRPEIGRIIEGISHPVKDMEVHRAICTSTAGKPLTADVHVH